MPTPRITFETYNDTIAEESCNAAKERPSYRGKRGGIINIFARVGPNGKIIESKQLSPLAQTIGHYWREAENIWQAKCDTPLHGYKYSPYNDWQDRGIKPNERVVFVGDFNVLHDWRGGLTTDPKTMEYNFETGIWTNGGDDLKFKNGERDDAKFKNGELVE